MTKVLIVDDAKFMRLALSSIFKKNNFEIVGLAENGQEAVQMFKELKPDIVTLDITMPVMNGIDALKEIIKIDYNAKVVMCSAMGQQKQVVQAIEQGAKDFIVKPFNEDRVLKTVTHILKSAESEEELIEAIDPIVESTYDENARNDSEGNVKAVTEEVATEEVIYQAPEVNGLALDAENNEKFKVDLSSSKPFDFLALAKSRADKYNQQDIKIDFDEVYEDDVEATDESPEIPVYEEQAEVIVETPETQVYGEQAEETEEILEIPVYEEQAEVTEEIPEIPVYEEQTEVIVETPETRVYGEQAEATVGIPEIPVYEEQAEVIVETPETPVYEEQAEATVGIPEIPVYEEQAEVIVETPETPVYEEQAEVAEETSYIPVYEEQAAVAEETLDIPVYTESGESDIPTYSNDKLVNEMKEISSQTKELLNKTNEDISSNNKIGFISEDNFSFDELPAYEPNKEIEEPIIYKESEVKTIQSLDYQGIPVYRSISIDVESVDKEVSTPNESVDNEVITAFLEHEQVDIVGESNNASSEDSRLENEIEFQGESTLTKETQTDNISSDVFEESIVLEAQTNELSESSLELDVEQRAIIANLVDEIIEVDENGITEEIAEDLDFVEMYMKDYLKSDLVNSVNEKPEKVEDDFSDLSSLLGDYLNRPVDPLTESKSEEPSIRDSKVVELRTQKNIINRSAKSNNNHLNLINHKKDTEHSEVNQLDNGAIVNKSETPTNDPNSGYSNDYLQKYGLDYNNSPKDYINKYKNK